jgi:adenylate cyclase
MSDVFISYARSTEPQAKHIEEALLALGYGVWRDDQLPAHRAYSEVLDERLRAAKAVLVVWSAEAVKSEWVQSEADRARTDKKLVQLTLDGAPLPMPFDRIQCADLTGWTGDPDAPGWRKVVASLQDLVGRAASAAPPTSAPAPASQPKAPPLPAKPSIAVLPFTDPAGAAEGDYFADGMVEEIAVALSRFQALFVIGSSSSLSYRGRERDVARIGRELGVRYLLEGSVRRAGPKVRISVTLVEAASGAQVWADRFEGTLEDVFALYDEVANTVAARLEPTILSAELRRGAARPTADLTAYDLHLRGRQAVAHADRKSWPATEALLEEAVQSDPAFAMGWAYLAVCVVLSVVWGFTADEPAARRKSRHAMGRALALGSDDPRVMIQIAQAAAMLGDDPASCETMAQRALALNPGSALSWTNGAAIAFYTGHPDRALQRCERALRLDPRGTDRAAIVLIIGSALEMLERYEEAVPWLEEGLTLRPGSPVPAYGLAHAYARLGRKNEARGMLARAVSLMPLDKWASRGSPISAFSTYNRQRREALESLAADD